MKYIGGGFIDGVPMRDLSEKEVKLYGHDRLLASGLYVDNENKSEVNNGYQSIKKNPTR
jgi:hypothetical protein